MAGGAAGAIGAMAQQRGGRARGVVAASPAALPDGEYCRPLHRRPVQHAAPSHARVARRQPRYHLPGVQGLLIVYTVLNCTYSIV